MSKRSSAFAITIQHVDWTKRTLGEWLLIDNYADILAIGEEAYHSPLDSDSGEPIPDDHDRHQHIYLKTNEKWLLIEIREHLELFTDGEFGLDIQACKSPKAWLIYLSKEDAQPYLHNVGVSQLSLFARAWHHAKTRYRYPQPINRQDHFIISCGQNARFAIGICEEHINNLRNRVADIRLLYAPNSRCSVVNDILLALRSSDHMYLYGEPGVGKTELVDWFLRGKKYWKAGEPSNFLFGTLPDGVDYVWFEDFKLEKYSMYMASFLSMMDKKEVTTSRKGVDDVTKLIHAKFIFLSNYTIPDDAPMFKRRLRFLEVEHKLYECNGCGSRSSQSSYVTDNQSELIDLSSR